MKKILSITAISLLLAFRTGGDSKSVHQFKVKTLEGKEFDFSSLKGKKVLIVNTASECGYTPQYKGLEELYEKYKDKNFVIIGFPCNDFGGQEPGTNDEIKSFCSKNYGVTFQMMDKVTVKGENAAPIYKWLTQKSLNGVADSEVKWNFNKYLIDENGKLVKYLPSGVKPMDAEITSWIEGK
ncbi:MAG: glutathione peroxidase [Bacteroidia bacterium]